ncbi:MAG: lytic murein transglycosylase B [Steroidobacteraceae bacterium]|jgi:membrane-bound lytic murein transglycosylase B|nr:lytic murein transglycosylase B [Steroidobacteraceae bacterium]
MKPTERLHALGLSLLLAACPAAALDHARADVRGFVAEMQDKHGLEREWLDEVFRKATSQPRIIDLISRPAERVKPWHEYRDHFLTEQRIREGVDFWVKHRARLAEIERSTGVNAHVIVGIIGVETFYGRITGTFSVLDALSTLAFDYPPRSPFFRSQLEHFLLLSREEPIDLFGVKGSYAGAMGAPQFMPGSYRVFAVDGDGDGRRDLWGSWDDVLASVANYLLEHGWRAGEPIVTPADLEYPGVEGLVANRLTLEDTVGSLRAFGVQFETPLGEDTPALFVDVAGDGGPEMRVGFTNFYAITRYNRSVMYALAVHDLGSQIAERLPVTDAG